MVLGLDIASRKDAYPGLQSFELKDGILYGPIPSRRLGFSLGVNLLPLDLKICTWDCLYCQCGWTDRSFDHTKVDPSRFPSLQILENAFEEGFSQLAREGKIPESITLSGNGEPTLHPRFGEAVEALLKARDHHLPQARTSVLSNGERLGEPGVRAALDRLDQRCMKLDAGDDALTGKVDRPLTPFRIGTYVERLQKLKSVTIQSFFMQGAVDNTTDAAVGPWLDCLGRIRPSSGVHLYSLDRVPPAKGLLKVPKETLEGIAAKVQALKLKAEVFA